jgi:hypothetical protein
MGPMRFVVVSAALTLAVAVSVLPIQVASAQTPSTTVVLPSSGTTVSGIKQYLDATATSGATQVQYELTGGSLSDQVIATATLTFVGWAAAWNTTTVANGSYTLDSVASYPGGVTATSAPIPMTVDNAPPTTTVVYPASGATLNSTETDYFDAVASPGVTEVTIDLNNVSGGGANLTLTTTPTLVGWIGVEPGTPIPPGGCGPIDLSYSIQSVASYAGGVSGTSAPVPVTVVAYSPPLPGGGC